MGFRNMEECNKTLIAAVGSDISGQICIIKRHV
jgi:hypothetical protein